MQRFWILGVRSTRTTVDRAATHPTTGPPATMRLFRPTPLMERVNCATVHRFGKGGHDTGAITGGSVYKNHIAFNPATFCEIPMRKSKIRGVLSNLAKDLSGENYDESLAQYSLGLDTTHRSRQRPESVGPARE